MSDYNENWMIQDIIDEGDYTETQIEKMRLCYFRGLSHSNNKKQIIAGALTHGLKKVMPNR